MVAFDWQKLSRNHSTLSLPLTLLTNGLYFVQSPSLSIDGNRISTATKFLLHATDFIIANDQSSLLPSSLPARLIRIAIFPSNLNYYSYSSARNIDIGTLHRSWTTRTDALRNDRDSTKRSRSLVDPDLIEDLAPRPRESSSLLVNAVH